MNKKDIIEKLKVDVYNANIELVKNGLVILTWGNVSGIDRNLNLVVIKPSGVDYKSMKPEDMVVVDLDGNLMEGKYKPSSDTPTHLELYRKFPNIGGVVHTHSLFATSFAQAGEAIVPYGTTHADTFHGPVPITRKLNKNEVEKDYELNTGVVIVESFKNVSYEEIPAVLVNEHGPFIWSINPQKAVQNAIILEEIAKMAYLTKGINPDAKCIEQYILDKHFLRKHGKDAYYGQKEEKDDE